MALAQVLRIHIFVTLVFADSYCFPELLKLRTTFAAQALGFRSKFRELLFSVFTACSLLWFLSLQGVLWMDPPYRRCHFGLRKKLFHVKRFEHLSMFREMDLCHVSTLAQFPKDQSFISATWPKCRFLAPSHWASRVSGRVRPQALRCSARGQTPCSIYRLKCHHFPSLSTFVLSSLAQLETTESAKHHKNWQILGTTNKVPSMAREKHLPLFPFLLHAPVGSWCLIIVWSVSIRTSYSTLLDEIDKGLLRSILAVAARHHPRVRTCHQFVSVHTILRRLRPKCQSFPKADTDTQITRNHIETTRPQETFGCHPLGLHRFQSFHLDRGAGLFCSPFGSGSPAHRSQEVGNERISTKRFLIL